MGEASQHTELTITEQRIMRVRLPECYAPDSPRICLQQIQKGETSSDETEAKRKAIIESLYWDYEDDDKSEQAARPEGTDPKADVSVCGIGGCTLRIFQAEDGSDIQTGECKAADYCLRERFRAVGSAATREVGLALYRDIIDPCEGSLGSDFCPKLHCDLSAGVSEDQIPGTHGTCAIRNKTPLEGFDQ